MCVTCDCPAGVDSVPNPSKLSMQAAHNDIRNILEVELIHSLRNTCFPDQSIYAYIDYYETAHSCY